MLGWEAPQGLWRAALGGFIHLYPDCAQMKRGGLLYRPLVDEGQCPAFVSCRVRTLQEPHLVLGSP